MIFLFLVEKQSHEFQAETKMLLDIVAKSLYSENEVWFEISEENIDANSLIKF